MRSAASCEARLWEKLWRNPFVSLGQKSILTCTSKAVKEAEAFTLRRKACKRFALPPAMFILPLEHGSGTVFLRAPMEGPTVCVQCDMPEERCTCERYCTICKGQHNIRLCSDGLYYCPDCREACDVGLASSRGR